MARQNINLGTSPNSGTGDNLRTAMDKVNDNFIEVYTAGPVGSNIVISGNAISSNVTNANIELSPNGTGKIVVKNDLLPDATNTRSLGSANNTFRGAHIGSVGLISAGPVTVPNYATEAARDAAITSPQAGMIILVLSDDSSSPRFQGYDGTDWVDLS